MNRALRRPNFIESVLLTMSGLPILIIVGLMATGDDLAGSDYGLLAICAGLVASVFKSLARHERVALACNVASGLLIIAGCLLIMLY